MPAWSCRTEILHFLRISRWRQRCEIGFNEEMCVAVCVVVCVVVCVIYV